MATYPAEEEGDANQSGALDQRVRMHLRYNRLMDSAVDGPCKARENTDDDEEANYALIENLTGKRKGGVGTLSWFSSKLTITRTELGFALKMWMARHPMHLRKFCVYAKASQIIQSKNNSIRTAKESAEGHFDDLTINVVDMSVPFFLSPDALQNSTGEKLARKSPSRMAEKPRRFSPTKAVPTKVRVNRAYNERSFAKTAKSMHAHKATTTLIAQKEREPSIVSKETGTNVAIMAARKSSVSEKPDVKTLSICHSCCNCLTNKFESSRPPFPVSGDEASPSWREIKRINFVLRSTQNQTTSVLLSE